MELKTIIYGVSLEVFLCILVDEIKDAIKRE